MEVLLQLEIVHHRAAFRALVPKAFRHVIAAVLAAQARLAENSHGACWFRD
jgi:hypothetical protein